MLSYSLFWFLVLVRCTIVYVIPSSESDISIGSGSAMDDSVSDGGGCIGDCDGDDFSGDCDDCRGDCGGDDCTEIVVVVIVREIVVVMIV